MLPRTAFEAWPLVEPYVENALTYAHGELTIESVKMHVSSGLFQLWTVWNKVNEKVCGAVTTCRQDYDHVRALRIVTLGGEHYFLWNQQLERALSKFARSIGANRLEASGRKGLIKSLKPLGFQQAYTTFIKEL